MEGCILFSHHLFDWLMNTVLLPLHVATAFMKGNLSKHDLLSKNYHQLFWSDWGDSFATHTKRRQMCSAQQGVTYNPESHVDKGLQFWVLSACSCADMKEMAITEIISILTNNNIDGKFDPDYSRKLKLVFDLFLNEDD